MNLDNSVTIEMTVRDALKAYVVLGKTNGSHGEIWHTLGEALGVHHLRLYGPKCKVNDIGNAIGYVNYNKIQNIAEEIYLNAISNTEKLKKIDELQKQIDELKESIDQ